MKKHHLKKVSLAGLVCACMGIIACALSSSAAAAPKPTPADTGGATITISRGPSVGSGFVVLSVDGKRLASLSQGRGFSGSLTPGKHTLSVIPDPNRFGQKPSNVELTAEKGQTYSFNLAVRSGDVVLLRNK